MPGGARPASAASRSARGPGVLDGDHEDQGQRRDAHLETREPAAREAGRPSHDDQEDEGADGGYRDRCHRAVVLDPVEEATRDRQMRGAMAYGSRMSDRDGRTGGLVASIGYTQKPAKRKRPRRAGPPFSLVPRGPSADEPSAAPARSPPARRQAAILHSHLHLSGKCSQLARLVGRAGLLSTDRRLTCGGNLVSRRTSRCGSTGSADSPFGVLRRASEAATLD